MKQFFKKNKITFLVTFLIGIGGFLRFYNLNWGAPFYFHPDERNIASAVSQLSFPSQLNPHFFAYNSLPIYLTYFSGYISNLFSFCNFQVLNCPVSFSQAIVIGRFYSALLSLLLIPSLYYIGKKLFGTRTGIIAALLALLSVGFIQFAHFSTFEMWLTFVGLWYFYACYQVAHTYRRTWSVIAGSLLGMLLAIKISSLILAPLIVVAILYGGFTKKYHGKIVGLLLHGSIVCLTALCIFGVTSPFLFLDYHSFRSSIDYESSVALGTLPVFYTGGFYGTVPIVFQFLFIYPFLLNPLLTVLFIPAFCFVTWQSIRTKHIQYLFLVTSYLLLFLSQAFLFAKWTRYMVPTLPFMYLIIAYAFSQMSRDGRKKRMEPAFFSLLGILLLVAALFSFAFFKTVYLVTDTRLAAMTYAKQHIPSSTPIVSEVYDLGITPFNNVFPSITLFNFYELDTGNSTYQSAVATLTSASAFIMPSQRIMRNRLLLPQKFPVGHRVYQEIVRGTLGYNKVYATPCDVWCTITYMGDPIFHVEETANVFDRPTVFIFEKK